MALTTMYAAQTNSPTTTLASAAGAADTTLIVTSAAVLPSTTPFELSLGIGEAAAETVLVTAVNGNTLTVTRGWDGTPQAWAVNTVCARTFSARDLNDMQSNILALQSDMAAMVDTGLTEQGKAADAYTVGRALYRTKDRTTNNPAGLTYWDATSLTSFTPADMPFNSFTEATGAKLSGFGDFTFGSSSIYLVWCWGNSHNAAVRSYLVMGRVGKTFIFGRSSNSGSTVSWTDWSVVIDADLTMTGAAADAATVGTALYGAKSRTANTPTGLTWANVSTLQTELGVNALTPSQIPPNSVLYTAGSNLDIGLVTTGSYWWLLKFRSASNVNVTSYLAWSVSGSKFYIGASVSSASTVSWLDASPKPQPTLKLAMFGDSIMRGIVNPTSSTSKNNDDNIPNGVANELGIVTGNFGIGSIGWINDADGEDKMPAYGYLKAFVEGNDYYYGDYQGEGTSYANYKFIGKGTLEDYNAVLLAFGANDSGSSLGTLATVQAYDGQTYDPDNIGYNTTIIEQVYRCVRYLRSQVPNLPIILMGPYISSFYSKSTGDGDYDVRNSGGWTKAECAALFKSFAEYYGCGFIDMHNMPRNPFDLNASLTLHVHPTKACYHEIAKYVAGNLGLI